MLTDPQLLSASDAILLAPTEIATLNAQRVGAVAGKAAALVADNTNKIFYDNEKSYIQSYFDELALMNGVAHTIYSDTDLDNGGQLAPGNVHFPQGVWVKMPPKMIISNNGNPTSSVDYESPHITTASGLITFIKTGFTDGATTEILVNAHSIGGTIDTATQFANGQRLVITDGIGVAYGIVQSSVLHPSVLLPLPVIPAYYAHTLIFTVDANISITGTAKNFHPGWTDLQRKETPAPLDVAFLHAMEAQLDAEIVIVKTKVDAEITALTGNGATGTEKTQNLVMKALDQTFSTNIANWSALPQTGTTSRFSDANLTTISSYFSSRPSDVASRTTQITTALGSVTQDGEGAFTGTGHYFSLFKWIDLRINLAYGTLRNYYNFGLIISFIDMKILGENNKVAEYGNIMSVKSLTADPTGNNHVIVNNTTGLTNGDSVKIIDADSPSLVVTISNIVGNDVQVSLSVPVFYTVSKQARLIKEL